GPEQNSNISTAVVDQAVVRVVIKVENNTGGFSILITVKRCADSFDSCSLDFLFLEPDGVLDSMKIHYQPMRAVEFEVCVLGFIGRSDLHLKGFAVMIEGNILHNDRFF